MSERLTEWVIRPGLGLGKLLFGASRYGVIRYLGEPEEERRDRIGSNHYITWHYPKLGVTADFDDENDFRLSTLNIERADAELFGLRLHGLREARVRSLLAPFALGPAEFERIDFLGLLSYPDQSLNLGFDHGRLDNIQWWYLFGADDEAIWPHESAAPT